MKDYEKRKEILALIAAKKEEIAAAKKEIDKNNAIQLALKLVLNGAYGAFAAPHFVCFCNAVASSITAHGREATRSMDKANEDYWYNEWHLDTELHQHLGVDDVQQIDSRWYNVETGWIVDKPKQKDIDDNLVKRKQAVSVYSDTDSMFVSLKPAMVSCNWSGDPLEFIHKVSKFRLTPYYNNKLNLLADGYKVKNIQNFETEQISKSIIFVGKKMYIKNVVWEDGSYQDSNPEWCKNGIFIPSETNLQPKGIDIVRSSTPLFARNKIKEIIKYYFQNPDTYNDRELSKLVRSLKEQFKLCKIEDISSSSSCNKYEEKVYDDQSSLSVAKGTHHAVKAAALHNYLLNNNSQYKSKYNLIKNGQKVKYYATKNELNDTFAYTPGMYPYEIAEKFAPIDYDKQFEKCILTTINRFNAVLGLSPLTSKLSYTLSVF
jgi:DNA polymerase elongation subunit (family B)